MPISLVDATTGECNAPDAGPTFPDFWLLYPRRVAKRDAEKAWLRLTEAQRLTALVAICSWRRVWADKDLEFVPHAASWLNGWRFDDELPPAYTQSSAAHQPYQAPADTPRGTIPAHVMALLAKLRGK